MHYVGQLYLGLFAGFFEPLQGHPVLGQVYALVPLELGNNPIHDALVEVVAAKVCVAVGGLDLEDALTYLQNGDVEGASTKVVHRYGLIALFIHSVGQRCGSRLVDDAQHLQSGYTTGVLCGVALAVVEVSGDGDDRLVYHLAQLGLCILLELPEHHGRYFRRGDHFVPELDVHVRVLGLDHLIWDALRLLRHLVIPAAHEPLYGEDGVVRVGHRLSLGGLPHVSLTCLDIERHGGRRGAATFVVLYYLRLPSVHDCHCRVGCSKVYANHSCHFVPPSKAVSQP